MLELLNNLIRTRLTVKSRTAVLFRQSTHLQSISKDWQLVFSSNDQTGLRSGMARKRYEDEESLTTKPIVCNETNGGTFTEKISIL